MNDIIHGDCFEALKTMADDSVDAIVTDPPYGLSFMGKKWDYDVPSVEIWAECLRVLKPGGHLLAFAGTRTQHRMAVRIEDAGFEIRDMIAWVYGSGFPKSLDVSKAIDKCNGQPDRLHRFTAWMRTTGLTARQLNKITDTNMGGHYLTAASQPAIPTVALWKLIRPHCGDVPTWVDELVQRIEAEREVVGKHNAPAKSIYSQTEVSLSPEVSITAPATDAAKQWQGWGTALKPALEPITVARKPFPGTVAENVLEYGTGAMNVDGCRVGTRTQNESGWSKTGSKASENRAMSGANYDRGPKDEIGSGRWPANLIHDGSDEVVGLFPEAGGGFGVRGKGRSVYSNGLDNDTGQTVGYGDSGSAARFFYCAKASKWDRDEGCESLPVVTHQSGMGGAMPVDDDGKDRDRFKAQSRNYHPTVKPTNLMRYLCRLVTPPNGLILDPFTGSGSTGKGAVLEGFRFIGIEREGEYVKIAKARIAKAVEDRKQQDSQLSLF